MKNRIGQITLFSTIGGLVLTQAGIQAGWLHGQAWFILAAGFEAGTIGGLADWFAVSALFREIPIPLIRKHTNIIVKNRDQLTEGIVDLVTNRWLSPEVIQEKLAEVSFSEILIGLMWEPQNQSRATALLRDMLARIAEGFDTPEAADFVQQILSDQIQNVEIAAPLGQWLESAIARGDHQPLWELLLDAARRTVDSEETRAMLVQTIGTKIKEYKREGFFRNMIFSVAAWVGGVKPDSISVKLLKSIDEMVYEARANPHHPLRKRFDQSMLEFARRLATGEPESCKIVDNLRRRLLDNKDASGMVAGVLQRFKATLSRQLHDAESPLLVLINTNIRRLMDELQSDAVAQQKLNTWLRETITQLVEGHHHEIGNMVRTSLIRLDDAELVAQIEAEVGNDLQYIRLNGAIVGGLAGIIIATIKMLLF
jgi:uncharacterized membrane-anchored protein YjiN (DUF445 family)